MPATWAGRQRTANSVNSMAFFFWLFMIDMFRIFDSYLCLKTLDVYDGYVSNYDSYSDFFFPGVYDGQL